jgi:hypothetical protein
MENGRFGPAEEGAPQGGVISPLILNITRTGWKRRPGCRLPPSWDRVERFSASFMGPPGLPVMGPPGAPR